MLDAFADVVGPRLPETRLPTHLKLIRFVLVILGVCLAIFGFASIGSALAGSRGAGLTTSFFGLFPMAFEGNWLAFASAPFAAVSAVVGWRLSMATVSLRAAAAVCLGWAVVSLLVSVAPVDARVVGAVGMALLAGSLLNAARDPRNVVLAPRTRTDRA